MKTILTLLILTFGINAIAADPVLQTKPANEYCFVWVGDQNGNFVARHEIRFVLDIRNPLTEKFEKILQVDGNIWAKIHADAPTYDLSIYKAGNEGRPLASGTYNRTGHIYDFNTTGFAVYTDTGEYSIACVTESYLAN